jgi:hypothetical protein
MAENEPYPTGPMNIPGDSGHQTTEMRPKKSRGFPKKLLFIVVGLLVLASIGYGAWKFITKAPPENKTVTQTTVEPEQTEKISNDIPEVTKTEVFKGDHPRLQFTYPTTWTVTPTEDLGIRIESPEFSYGTVDKGEVTGYFRIYIRQGARKADGTIIGRGVAIKPSEIIKYTEPAIGQRPETNLTSFGLDDDNHFAYFLIAGNYSLKQGDTLGPDYGKEPETYIITGGFSSEELTDDLATNAVPLDSYADSNAYTQALDIIKSLKLL